MKHIDHKDRECVVLTYGLYQTCMKENYSLEDMMRILAEKMPEKRSDLVQEEETVRNFRITKGEETDRNFRDFRENSEDIREWKGKEETEEQEKLEISGSYQKSSVRRLVKKLFFLLVFLVTVIGGTWFLYGAEILAQFGSTRFL